MKSTKVQLGTMMFLQYAIWGAWAPVLSSYLLNDLGFSGSQVGWIYALLPLATIIAPIVGGQVADRYFASEKVIAFLQLGGGLLLLLAARTTDFDTLAVVMLFYCLLYAPTLALTNSVAMINMEDSEKEFGAIRVWGTLGWIAAGLMLTGWRWFGEADALPAMQGDMLFLAGVLSIVMGLQAFLLPHTPPQKEGVSPWAFLESFKMLKVKDFAVFVGITFVVATELEFYYILTAPFLESDVIGVSSRNIPAVMTIAQFAEIFVMAFFLSWSLKRYGMRKTLAIGVLAGDRLAGAARVLLRVLFRRRVHLRGQGRAARHPGLRAEPDRDHRAGLRALSREPVRWLDPGCVYHRRGHQLDVCVPRTVRVDDLLRGGIRVVFPGGIRAVGRAGRMSGGP
jgi:nucleoside transporter